MLGELNIGYAQLGPDEKTHARLSAARDLNTLVNPAFDTGHDLAVPLRRPPADARHASQQRGDRPHRRRRLASSATSPSCTPTRTASSGWSRALIEEGAVINPLDADAAARPRALRAVPPQGRRARRARRRADPRRRAPLAREGRQAHLVRFHHGARRATRSCSAPSSCAWPIALASERQGAAADVHHPLRHEEPRFRRPHRRHRAARRSRRPTSSSSPTSISSPNGRTTASPRACACRTC